MDELMNETSMSCTSTMSMDYYNHNDFGLNNFKYSSSHSSSFESYYSPSTAASNMSSFDEVIIIDHNDENENKENNNKENEVNNSLPSVNTEEEDDDNNVKAKKEENIIINRRNLIIWDWDDTIFPTYSFRTHQDQKDEQFMYKLQILVSYIERLFTDMIKLYGESAIIIVTNASETWIHKCLNVDLVQETFLPFQKLLKKYDIQCISASTRDITSKYPKNHHKWKEIAFDRIFTQYFQSESDDEHNNLNDIQCITSIGDSLCEYNASHTASKWIKNRILNRIRLKSNPSINDMIFQLKEILSMIDQFGINLDDIDIDYSSLSPLSMSHSDTTC